MYGLHNRGTIHHRLCNKHKLFSEKHNKILEMLIMEKAMNATFSKAFKMLKLKLKHLTKQGLAPKSIKIT